MGKDKWAGLINYLNSTDAKPESVLNLVKNTWKPRGKSKVKTELSIEVLGIAALISYIPTDDCGTGNDICPCGVLTG